MKDDRIYYKLTKSEREIIENVIKITATDYDIVGNIMPVSSFFSITEDLLGEIYHLYDLIDEMKEERHEEQGDEVEEMKIREEEK